eukprot:3509649-Rhodomonas_salina.1
MAHRSQAASRGKDTSSSDLSNSLCSLASMKARPDPRALEDLCAQCTSEAPTFTPKQVSSSLWALASMKVTDRKLCLLYTSDAADDM